MGDNPMGKSILLPGVKSHYEKVYEDCLEPNGEQRYDSESGESAEEEDEEVAPVNEIALTPEV
jgi:hypothetical protein